MEQWSLAGSAIDNRIIPVLQHPITPLPHYSITPILHHSAFVRLLIS